MEKDHRAHEEGEAENPSKDRPASPPASSLNLKHQKLINQHLPLGIVEASPEGKYLDVNGEFCRMLGYEKKELLQRGIKEVTDEEDYHVDNKLHSRLVAGEIPYYKIEKRFVRKDGQVIWADLTRSAIRAAGGKALYTVGMILDITERHLAEEALLRARTKAEKTTDRITRLQKITAALTGIATTQATRAAAGEELVEAVRSLHAGKRYFSPQVSKPYL